VRCRGTFGPGSGNDTISGSGVSNGGQGLIDITALFGEAVVIEDIGAHTLITIAAHGAITLLNVGNAAAVTLDGDFIL